MRESRKALSPNKKMEKRTKSPICPICEEKIEAPHLSCIIPCEICKTLISNLNFYIYNEDKNSIVRFCTEKCQKVYFENGKPV